MSNVIAKSDNVRELPQSFAAEVWGKLSRVDVGDYIETKGDRVKLPYLSWTFAWAETMKVYPESCFILDPEERFEDGTVNARITVCIVDGNKRLERQMWLPVMDHTNKAVTNPNARQISDTRMRCLVKCLAFFGLGLDVYAKSDMPIGSTDDPLDQAQIEMLTGLLKSAGADVTNPTNIILANFLNFIGSDSLDSIPRIKYKQALTALETKVKQRSANR